MSLDEREWISWINEFFQSIKMKKEIYAIFTLVGKLKNVCLLREKSENTYNWVDVVNVTTFIVCFVIIFRN